MKYKQLITIDPKYVEPKSISMHEIYMNLAIALSMKSTCKRGKAGCVVTRYGRIISTGYNGSPSHAEECISREACRQQGSIVAASMNLYSQPKNYEIKTDGCFDSIHGEANAFGYCCKHGIQTDGSVVYLTGPPCKPCSQLMVACGVKTVYYNNTYYRNDDGLLYCRIYGIELIKMENE